MKIIARAKLFSTLLIFFLSSASLLAQDYYSTIGVRVGSERGLTFKQMLTPEISTEEMLVHHKDGFHVIGLAAYQLELGRNTGSYLYVGLGGHIGYRDLLNAEKTARPMGGVDAVLGFEYVFPRSPLVFSVDMKPQLELIGGVVPSGNHAAVSLRYIIN